jgi:hypothetical protein
VNIKNRQARAARRIKSNNLRRKGVPVTVSKFHCLSDWKGPRLVGSNNMTVIGWQHFKKKARVRIEYTGADREKSGWLLPRVSAAALGALGFGSTVEAHGFGHFGHSDGGGILIIALVVAVLVALVRSESGRAP